MIKILEILGLIIIWTCLLRLAYEILRLIFGNYPKELLTAKEVVKLKKIPSDKLSDKDFWSIIKGNLYLSYTKLFPTILVLFPSYWVYSLFKTKYGLFCALSFIFLSIIINLLITIFITKRLFKKWII